jgi:hypothetical protein
MEIISWKGKEGGQLIRVSRKEALELIASLSQQLLSGDCNNDRAEFIDQGGRYFSISVHDRDCNPRCPISKAFQEETYRKLLSESFNVPSEQLEQNYEPSIASCVNRQ